MSESIRRRLESFIPRGEYLQSQFSMIKTPKTIKSDVTRDVVGEAAKIITRDILDLPWGRKASKYSKAFLRQQEEKQKKEAEQAIEIEYNIWSQNLIGYLSTVSLIKTSLSTVGNSFELVNRVKRAQDAKRLDTKLRGVVSAIRTISTKNLILNSDIPAHIVKNRPKKKQAPMEIIIPPGKPFSGERALAEIIENSEGYVWVMDPYVDGKTLDLLLNAPSGHPIRLLTCFTGGASKERRFLRLCEKFKVEQPGFEIRKCDSKLIHDRFIITKTKGWSVGASLKDTGKKLTMIKELSKESRKEINILFEEIWNKSVNC